MNYLIHQLLNTEEINLIKKELDKCNLQDWEDGKKTAGSHASMVKNNLQLNRNNEISKNIAQLINKKFFFTTKNTWNILYKIFKQYALRETH